MEGQYGSGFRTAGRPTHYGIDTTDGRGAVVRAAADGTVILMTCNASLGGQAYSCDVDGSPSVAGCGWYLDILHAGGVVTRFCHLLERPSVTVGEQVAAGQPIGLVGTSGRSSGRDHETTPPRLDHSQITQPPWLFQAASRRPESVGGSPPVA